MMERLQDCQKSMNRSSKMSVQPISQWNIKNEPSEASKLRCVELKNAVDTFESLTVDTLSR